MTTPTTITPEQLEAHKKWINGDADGTRLVLRNADLRRAVLTDVDLRRAVLTDADLTDVDLRRAVLTDADLRRADLRRADLTGAVLQGADLTDADLRRADLTGADLTGADLTGDDLTDADLTDAVLTGAIGLPIAADATERLQAVARAALEPNALEMNAWHTCDTTHCMAGWAVHLAGEPGRLLEAAAGTEVAGLYLLGAEAHRYFFKSNEEARQFLQGVLENA